MTCDVAPRFVADERRRLITGTFVLVMVACFVYFVAIGAMIPTLPRFVKRELGGGGLEVGLGVGSFAVSAALMRPWIGRIGDTRGRRVLAVGGALVVGISMLAYSLAVALPLLIAARLVTGIGEAAFFTGVLTAIQDMAPDDRRGEASSYFSVAVYGGLAVGPPLGEMLLTASNFPTVFVVFGGCCLLAALLGHWVPVGEIVEHVHGRGLLHHAAVLPGLLLTLGLFPVMAYVAFMPVYADDVGFDHVANALTLYGGLILTVRIVGARLPDALGWRRASTIALVGTGCGISVLGVWGSAPSIWMATVCLAVGMSMLYPALLNAVMVETSDGDRSHAIGTFGLFFDLAQGLGPAVVGGVVSLSNERTGFVVAGLCAGIGLLAQRFVRQRLA